MAKTYEYLGEKFEVDDSEGCYVTVKYEGQTGWAGVSLVGPKPYTWISGSWAEVKKDGIQHEGSQVSFEQALNVLCGQLSRQVQDALASARLDREKLCEEMHEFMSELD